MDICHYCGKLVTEDEGDIRVSADNARGYTLAHWDCAERAYDKRMEDMAAQDEGWRYQ